MSTAEALLDSVGAELEALTADQDLEELDIDTVDVPNAYYLVIKL